MGARYYKSRLVSLNQNFFLKKKRGIRFFLLFFLQYVHSLLALRAVPLDWTGQSNRTQFQEEDDGPDHAIGINQRMHELN